MIDMEAYHTLHPDDNKQPRGEDDLDSVATLSDEPPAEPFSLLLPPKIKGYGLHNKKWGTSSPSLWILSGTHVLK